MTFQKIYDHITSNKRCPQLATKNMHVITEWIAAGYDTDKDIIPAIDEATKHGGRTIYSFKFFTRAIQEQHEKRLREGAEIKEVTPKRRAEVNAWKRKMDMPYDEQFLNNYEEQHGRVEA